MIKASVLTLYLSSEAIEPIDPTPTLPTAIAKYLNAIASRIEPEITTLKLDYNPHPLDRKVPIVLGADPHNLLLRATLSNPSLSLNSAIDILLRRFVPIIRNDARIMGTNDLEALPVEEYSQIKLQFGCLVSKRRASGKEYWYWRYYVENQPRDDYIKGSLDRVLAHVERVGIPPKARPKRLNKAKKVWEVKVG